MQVCRLKVGLANFPNLATKVVAMATSLERSEKGQIVHLQSHRAYQPFGKNLVKVSPVDTEIIGLQGITKNKI